MTEFVDVQLGGNPAMFIMNRDRYAALPEAARAVLDAHAGAEFAGAMGAFLDAWNEGAKGMAGQGGNRVRSLTEAELAREYNTVEALRTHPRLAKFITWVQKRPPGFRSKVPGKRRKR